MPFSNKFLPVGLAFGRYASLKNIVWYIVGSNVLFVVLRDVTSLAMYIHFINLLDLYVNSRAFLQLWESQLIWCRPTPVSHRWLPLTAGLFIVNNLIIYAGVSNQKLFQFYLQVHWKDVSIVKRYSALIGISFRQLFGSRQFAAFKLTPHPFGMPQLSRFALNESGVAAGRDCLPAQNQWYHCLTCEPLPAPLIGF